MIGSPDLLVFGGGEGFGDEPTPNRYTPALPNELSIPLKPRSNPWTSTAQFNRDFILVAEFSEQVGPQPVMTVPEDPLVLGSFDLNHFSVRIMSVDYQAAFPAPAATAASAAATAPGGPRLNFTEDSRVVMGDSADGAFAYVQHMTLYDLEARGFVRPFCMAYVSSDQRKLMELFGELSARFTQASDSLKTGNRSAFAMELQRKLQELEYTRLIVQQGAELQRADSEPRHAGETDEGLEALEGTILNYRDLLHQVTAYPNRKLKKSGFLPYDPPGDLADPLPPATPCPFPPPLSSSVARLERRLKNLEELSGAYFVSVAVEQLANTERRLRGDRSALQGARLTRDLSRKLPLTNFLFELWKPEEGVDEPEEHPERLEPQLSLESFSSCVEELPIKLEEEPEGGRAGVRSRGPEEWGAAEMAGSVSSGDSIEVLGTERSYRSQRPVAGDDHRETTLGKSDPWLRQAPPPEAACSRRVRAYAVRGNSEDSIEVLSTTDSIVPEDLQAITEEEGSESQDDPPGGPHARPARGEGETDGAERFRAFLEQVAILRDERGDQRGTVGDRGKAPPLPAERDQADGGQPPGRKSVSDGGQGETARRDAVLEGTTAVRQVEGNSVALPSKPPPGLRADSLTMTSDLPTMGGWSFPSTPLRKLSVDEASESTGSSKSPSQSDAFPRLDKRCRRKAGLRALRFIQQNSFSQHAVFCLLSGRPLIVIGGDASRVTRLVSALTLFLPAPGPNGASVLPFIDKPLQLTDLLAKRLIGLHRTSSATSLAVLHSLARYRRYLALLDLDQRTLRCPAYSGSLMARIANRHSSISRGGTYLLHLESCLTALANQALLYTFHPLHQREDDHVVDEQGTDTLLLESGFCSSEDDLRAMRFLSDLIKQYHARCGPPILGVSYRQMQIHKHIAAP